MNGGGLTYCGKVILYTHPAMVCYNGIYLIPCPIDNPPPKPRRPPRDLYQTQVQSQPELQQQHIRPRSGSFLQNLFGKSSTKGTVIVRPSTSKLGIMHKTRKYGIFAAHHTVTL